MYIVLLIILIVVFLSFSLITCVVHLNSKFVSVSTFRTVVLFINMYDQNNIYIQDLYLYPRLDIPGKVIIKDFLL